MPLQGVATTKKAARRLLFGKTETILRVYPKNRQSWEAMLDIETGVLCFFCCSLSFLSLLVVILVCRYCCCRYFILIAVAWQIFYTSAIIAMDQRLDWRVEEFCMSLYLT